MSLRSLLLPAATLVVVVPCACSSPAPREATGSRDDAVTSLEASIIDFGFDGEVVTDAHEDTRDAIVRQLLYTFGVLRTNDQASGQIGNVHLSNVSESGKGSMKRATYHAVLPVAWPKGEAPPDGYELAFPRDVRALQAFDGKYDGSCGKGEHGEGNFWHDWNPRASGCTLGDDVVRAPVRVSPHSEARLRFPEYDRIWSDGRLDVTAIFTIIESAERPNDWGYTEAQRFVQTASADLEGVQVRQNDRSPSLLVDLTVTGRTSGDDPRDVAIDVLVTDKVTEVGADFDTRYAALSERADLILFNGHARLGANTNALARKGKVVPGKYQLVLLNACDTFALVDGTMRDRRREANGGADPNGTRFLDVISNAQPGRSDNLASVSLDVLGAALSAAETPASYSRIIESMPKEQVAVVYGEEDNTFLAKRSLPAVYDDGALSRW